jgi:flagellar biosynthesis repressor protein FlbT
MGLKITLKPSEKMIVGNAVISNSGSSDCYISVENNSTILREKNIMCEKDAKTPCQQLYFIIQLMYIDPENISVHQRTYWKLSKDIVKAAPSTYNIIDEINLHISSENYYKALKGAHKLIDYETELLSCFISNNIKSVQAHKFGASLS